MEELKQELATIMQWHNEQIEEAEYRLAVHVLLIVIGWLATLCVCCMGIYSKSSEPNGTFAIIVCSIIAVALSAVLVAVLIRSINSFRNTAIQITHHTAEQMQIVLNRTLGTVHYPPEQPRKKVF